MRLWCLEDIVGSGKPKLQRYPLRSGTKLKEEKPPVPELSNPSSTSVSKPRYNLLVLFLQMFGIWGVLMTVLNMLLHGDM